MASNHVLIISSKIFCQKSKQPFEEGNNTCTFEFLSEFQTVSPENSNDQLRKQQKRIGNFSPERLVTFVLKKVPRRWKNIRDCETQSLEITPQIRLPPSKIQASIYENTSGVSKFPSEKKKEKKKKYVALVWRGKKREKIKKHGGNTEGVG